MKLTTASKAELIKAGFNYAGSIVTTGTELDEKAVAHFKAQYPAHRFAFLAESMRVGVWVKRLHVETLGCYMQAVKN